MKLDREKTALDLLNEYVAANGWMTTAWDEANKRRLVLASFTFNTEDPSYDREFYQKRDTAARCALLIAKAAIIRSMNVEMSVGTNHCPNTSAGIRFAETCELEENKLLAQKQAVAELLKDYDGVKAAALEKEKLGDRLYALLDAAIRNWMRP